MNHGLDAKTLRKIHRILAVFPEIDQALLYGSRAMGNFKPGSDIDLTLVGESLDWALCGEIKEMFAASSLPYMVDVSVLALLQHPDLRAHIERVGVVLYDRAAWAASRDVRRGAEGGG